jgi:hypothetical protein
MNNIKENNMKHYRIVRYKNGYEVQKKYFWFWKNLALYNCLFHSEDEAREFLCEYLEPTNEIILEIDKGE